MCIRFLLCLFSRYTCAYVYNDYIHIIKINTYLYIYIYTHIHRYTHSFTCTHTYKALQTRICFQTSTARAEAGARSANKLQHRGVTGVNERQTVGHQTCTAPSCRLQFARGRGSQLSLQAVPRTLCRAPVLWCTGFERGERSQRTSPPAPATCLCWCIEW